ncbi:hypothetical protein [Hymenobacter nivis]|uniref:hypothetical protein n=1 Tax=Hymenobacter nivis TaxID=1850093 RepID=UPI0013A53EF1|nr:hypothetical protein [Hymenobacter nivis]
MPLLPAPARPQPLAERVLTTDRGALPRQLNWSGTAPCPPIGCRVEVNSNGIALGEGTVRFYYYAQGELGCVVALDNVPPFLALVLSPDTQLAHFWGEALERLDQGEEPEEADEDETRAREQAENTAAAETAAAAAAEAFTSPGMPGAGHDEFTVH